MKLIFFFWSLAVTSPDLFIFSSWRVSGPLSIWVEQQRPRCVRSHSQQPAFPHLTR